MAVIGWIGLGHMGSPMSSHLVAAGHDVRGFDLDETANEVARGVGVRVVGSIADAVTGADAVFTSLPRNEHVREVYAASGGVWAHAPRGALLLDTSTVDIETSSWCHERSSASGHRFVDAPVSGGIAGAMSGSLTFMPGGAADVVDAARPLVEPMASHVFDLGGPTLGIAAKLANNLMLFVSLLGVAEGAQLAAALGLDPRRFFEVASVSSGDSWPLRTWYPAPDVVPTSPANRNFDATFTTALAEKDLTFAVEAAEASGLEVPAAEIALDQFRRLIAEGYAEKDCSLVAKFPSPDGTVAGFTP